MGTNAFGSDPVVPSGASPIDARPRPSPRDAAGLLSGTMLLGLGERLGERFVPLLLVNLGGGPLAVGLHQAGANLVGAASSLPGGYLADRIGTKSALQLFAAMALVAFLVLALARSWPLAVAASILCVSWSAVSLPAALVLITAAVPTRNTAWGVSLHSLVRRIPMAAGPIIAGGLIASLGENRGLRAAYGLAGGLAAATLILQHFLIGSPLRGTTTSGGAPHAPFGVKQAFASMGRPLRELLMADTLIRFCEQIPYAFVVLWCMREIGHPITALQFGGLTAIEMGTAMLVYLPGAWLSTRIGKPASVSVTFTFFALFPLVLLASRSFGALVLAFVVRGLKELGEPTRKSLILDLCPEGSRATYFGRYYLIRDLLATLGAALGAALWSRSPVATLLVASGFGLTGVVWYARVASRGRGDATR